MQHAANVALDRRYTAHNFSHQFRCRFDAFGALKEPTAGQRDQHLPQNLGGARRLARDIGLSPPASTSRFRPYSHCPCKRRRLSCERWMCWMFQAIPDVEFRWSGYGMSQTAHYSAPTGQGSTVLLQRACYGMHIEYSESSGCLCRYSSTTAFEHALGRARRRHLGPESDALT